MLTPDSIVHAREGRHVFSKTGDEVVIMGVETGQYYSLNPVGARFWTALQQPVSIRAAATLVTAEFEVSQATAESDLAELAEQLIRAGLVELVPAAGA